VIAVFMMPVSISSLSSSVAAVGPPAVQILQTDDVLTLHKLP